MLRFGQTMATERQVKYIASLFDDCGFSGQAKKAWLIEGYKVNYTDELTLKQASSVIEYLIGLKKQKGCDKDGPIKF